jgi:hypothetical protein
MPVQTENHPALIAIEDTATLWRYVDLEKFKSLLAIKALFFCRASKFSDPFEGSITKKEIEFRKGEPKRIAKFYKIPYDEEKGKKSISDLSSYHENLKDRYLINCWHINKGESDAMWRLYLKDNEGVAIQTTPKKLFKSLLGSEDKIYASKVRYLDYENDIWYHKIDYPCTNYNFFVPLVHKRHEFIHESEFRLLIEVQEAATDKNYWDKQPNRKGHFISVDVMEMVEKIILPPTIDPKTKEEILQIISNYGYSFTCEDSKLRNEPMY